MKEKKEKNKTVLLLGYRFNDFWDVLVYGSSAAVHMAHIIVGGGNIKCPKGEDYILQVVMDNNGWTDFRDLLVFCRSNDAIECLTLHEVGENFVYFHISFDDSPDNLRRVVSEGEREFGMERSIMIVSRKDVG